MAKKLSVVFLSLLMAAALVPSLVMAEGNPAAVADLPATGDDSPLGFYMLLLMAAVIVLAILIIKRGER